MINTHDYKFDGRYRNYQRAKKRKLELKEDGFRVKIRKEGENEYQIWIKDVRTIGIQERQGNGRNGWIL